MIKTAFIFHGSNGNPGKHWYPWLKDKLEEKDLEVYSPKFPIENKQSLKNWLQTLKQHKDKINNSILVGHSLGGPFIVDILDQWDVNPEACFIVSGFIGHLEAEGEPNINDFSDRDFNWNRIKNRCSSFYMFHSDNDPYVPLENAKKLADKLNADLIVIKKGEHFQSQSGYEKFEELLKKIEEEI